MLYPILFLNVLNVFFIILLLVTTISCNITSKVCCFSNLFRDLVMCRFCIPGSDTARVQWYLKILCIQYY